MTRWISPRAVFAAVLALAAPGGNGPIDFDDPLLRSSLENSLCPNQQVEDSEQCDDNNTIPGDGCAMNCRFYNCGDGEGDSPFEECDDGNVLSGDGCDGRLCFIEPGFACVGTPSVCAAVCGDGLIRGVEACDDGNTVDGDGCDALCVVEPGFICTGQPSVCVMMRR